jgi:DNA replication protein DnaC
MKTNSRIASSRSSELRDETPDQSPDMETLEQQLQYLKLPTVRQHAVDLARKAAQNGWDPLRFLCTLINLEVEQREDKRAQRLVAQAKIPVVKTMDTFDWNWPTSINRGQIESLFDLRFIEQKTNLLLFANPGLGKTHIASALGYAAALAGHRVLFANTIEVVNCLQSAVMTHTLPQTLRTYLKPQLLVLDELGYLPLDQRGGDLLFQVISQRYERGSLVITTNKIPQEWASVFKDAALATAVLDRIAHHCQTVVIEGESYRQREALALIRQ